MIIEWKESEPNPNDVLKQMEEAAKMAEEVAMRKAQQRAEQSRKERKEAAKRERDAEMRKIADERLAAREDERNRIAASAAERVREAKDIEEQLKLQYLQVRHSMTDKYTNGHTN